MRTTGKKEEGFLKLLKQIEVNNYLDKFEEGQHFEIEVTLPDEKMSDRHRKYYFAGVITPAAKILRMDVSDLHAYYKSIFLLELMELKGQVFPIYAKGNEFKDLSSKKMTIYVDNVRADLRSLDNLFNIVIDTEDPEDYWQRRNDGVLL